MKNLVARAYHADSDLQTMTDLLQRLRSSGQVVYPIAADLFEELAEPEVQASARLWEDKLGNLVGFVYINRYQNLVDVFTAGEFTPTLESRLLQWAVTAMQLRNRARGEAQTLDAGALASDRSRQAFLERHGFQRLEESSVLMARSLIQSIPKPQLPPGFTIRPLAGEAELPAYVALHRAAFGSGHMTMEYRQTILRSPDYLRELDLVAIAPNGELAAFCMGQVFPDDAPRAGGQREGWTDPVGTHPTYRRRGLAKALILTCMQLLQDRGIDRALLGTMSTNHAMQRLAQSIGFQTASNTLWYSRSV